MNEIKTTKEVNKKVPKTINQETKVKTGAKKKLSKNSRLWKVIRLPVDLFIILSRFLTEKLEFSIRFKLSLSYLRIFLRAMLWAALGILLVFGGLTVYDSVSEEYLAVKEILNQEGREYSDLRQYSQEQNLPVFIYDRAEKLVFSTNPELAYDGYTRLIDIVRTEEDIYLAVNISILDHSIPDTVIYSDVQAELEEVLHIAKIILLVFPVIIFFSMISIVFLGKGFFDPLKDMTQTVKDISERNLNLRLNVSGSKNELKELALTFNEMMNRIEEHDNRQKQFVSDASHELRTPIAVIQGYIDLLNRWGKDDQAVLQESIEAIKNESENMKELIDKLLFLARHDKDNFVLQKEEFSIAEMMQEIAKETQIIDETHIIKFNIDQELTIYADRNRIKQAVRIFIDNAIKYTSPGGEIEVSLGNEGGYLVINIKDTGVGINKEEMEHIFDRFYRSEQSRTKEKGGHGLGLAIAKIIVLGHNGKLKVKSKPGQGSEFIILLKER